MGSGIATLHLKKKSRKLDVPLIGQINMTSHRLNLKEDACCKDTSIKTLILTKEKARWLYMSILKTFIGG